MKSAPIQMQTFSATNKTGLPDDLKAAIEAQSGLDMDDVKVHYNSAQPAQFAGNAGIPGATIHLAEGEEAHLPHQAWHVVQQQQGRVAPAAASNIVAVNDDKALEQEADEWGKQAVLINKKTRKH